MTRVWHLNLTWSGPRVDGITAAVKRLARAQAAQGADTRIFSPALDAARPRVVISALKAGLDDPDSRPDVVHFHSLFRPMHTGLARFLRRRRIPYVVSPHSAAAAESVKRRGALKRAYAVAAERRFVADASVLSCLTEVERADLVAFAGEFAGEAIIAPNPLDELPERITWNPPPDRLKVVALSRFDVRQKGLDRLQNIAARCADVEFVVHGEVDKNQPALAERLRRIRTPNLRFQPPVFGAAKDAALRQSTMFVLPSRWEGLSMSLAEALAAGVPCAVSSYVAGTLPFEASGLGHVLDDDPSNAAVGLRAALDDRAALAAWSHAGAEFARRHFDPETVARTTLDAYERASQAVAARPVGA